MDDDFESLSLASIPEATPTHSSFDVASSLTRFESVPNLIIKSTPTLKSTITSTSQLHFSNALTTINSSSTSYTVITMQSTGQVNNNSITKVYTYHVSQSAADLHIVSSFNKIITSQSVSTTSTIQGTLSVASVTTSKLNILPAPTGEPMLATGMQ